MVGKLVAKRQNRAVPVVTILRILPDVTTLSPSHLNSDAD
jgi:hypothetical protein